LSRRWRVARPDRLIPGLDLFIPAWAPGHVRQRRSAAQAILLALRLLLRLISLSLLRLLPLSGLVLLLRSRGILRPGLVRVTPLRRDGTVVRGLLPPAGSSPSPSGTSRFALLFPVA